MYTAAMISIPRIPKFTQFKNITKFLKKSPEAFEINGTFRNFSRTNNLLSCVEIKQRCDIKPTATVYAECSGMCMPAFILGTWNTNDIKQAECALTAAFKVGYRAIDTSTFYGNETALGCALEPALKEACLKREDIFIITKLPFDAMNCEKVKESVCKSLKSLKTPYIDLYMINFPAGSCKDECGRYVPDPKVDHGAIWKGMEEMVDLGKIKYLGVCNFNCNQLMDLVKCAKIKPSNVQVEINVFFQDENYRKMAKGAGITVTGFAPFGRSAAMDKMLKDKCIQSDLASPMEDPCICSIAKKLCKNNGQVLLRFLLQLDDNLAVVVGGSDPKMICENFGVFEFNIEQKEIETLKGLDKGNKGRAFNKDVFKLLFPAVEDSPFFPFSDC